MPLSDLYQQFLETTHYPEAEPKKVETSRFITKDEARERAKKHLQGSVMLRRKDRHGQDSD